MTIPPMSLEVRQHAARTHQKKVTRAARAWLVMAVFGGLVWVLVVSLARLALGVAP